MFTFGRDRELEYVGERHGQKRTGHLLRAVVASVHDYLDGAVGREAVEEAIEAAFVDGEGGIWETAGSWLLKLNTHARLSEHLWQKLASHSKATVRVRVACFLDEIAEELARELHARLSNDRSKRVQLQASSKWDFRVNPAKYDSR